MTKKQKALLEDDIDTPSLVPYNALLEQDLAESMVLNNRNRCTRLTQYLGSFFKSKSATTTTPAHTELKNVIVNPTFVPRSPGASS
jgi:hypothetical protein